MKVFLLENVASLGKMGEIKEVKTAYGYNFLLPKKLAVLPNDQKALELMASRQSKKMAEKENLQAQETAVKSLNGKKFVIKAKADENGHLYGSIGPKEIALVTGLNADKISTHFKQTGVFPLEISAGKIKAKIQIEIINN